MPGNVGQRVARPAEIKRSFRYHRLPATAAVHAEAVLPELRVVEQGKLDITDERIVLSSHLDVTISKSGLFAVDLRIPDLTGVMTGWIDKAREIETDSGARIEF